MLPKGRADKSRCPNLQKGEEVVSVIFFRDVISLILPIHLAEHRQKILDDPILLSAPYLVLSTVSLDGFALFLETLDGIEPPFSPETFDDLMLLAREFEYNSLVVSLTLQRDVPRCEENIHDWL
jgi:hypothetical protein